MTPPLTREALVERIARATYLHMFPECSEADWNGDHAMADDGRLKNCYLDNARSVLAAIHESGLGVVPLQAPDNALDTWWWCTAVSDGRIARDTYAKMIAAADLAAEER